jgi:cyclohexanecarboxylate-CoA ligase
MLRETGAPAPPAVREVRTGGAAVPPSLVADVAEVLRARVVVQWGMTEVGIGCYTSGTAQSRDGGVGSPVPGARLRVVGADGTVSRVGEIGELQIDTPFGFSGYFGAPELTRAAHTDDGWIRTGDLAALDVAGEVLLHGREDERINRGGLKFSAAEVESLLADLPGLRQCVVVPRPDPRLGERAVLVVSLRDGATVTLDEITAHLRGKGIALYKLPESLIVLDAVPTNAVGKVARVLVRRAVDALETAPA